MMAKHLLTKRDRSVRYNTAQYLSARLCAMVVLWLSLAISANAAQADPAQTSAAQENTEQASENQRLPGKFVWAELVTYDAALSETFYSQLFDWHFDDDDDYRVAWHGDDPVGGIVVRPRKDPAGKSRWIAYMSVEHMAEGKAAAAAAGAKLLADTRHITGLGDLAVYADSEGALFGIIDGEGSDPGDYLADVGDWIWLQLFSRSAQRASAFYEHIGNYQRFDNPQSAGSFLLVREGYARAAISTLPAKNTDTAPAWVPFLRVADIQSTLEKAQALGGKILVAPRADLYDNRVAMIEAPDGSAVGILVWKADAAEVSR
jgi:predicted enzyme related to lactoylglutathione lyase